jgi:hypothetical protein
MGFTSLVTVVEGVEEEEIVVIVLSEDLIGFVFGGFSASVRTSASPLPIQGLRGFAG